MNKIRFTRLAGVVAYPGGVYAVYNYRDGMQKWMGEGEFKIKLHLQQIFYPLREFEYPLREAAIMFGIDYTVALDMLREMKETKNLGNGIFSVYKNIFFVPQNEFGVRLLRVLTTPDWNEQILEGLFEDEDRSYNKGTFSYDAYKDGAFELSFLDGDISRLFRFREAILDRDGMFKVICYSEQITFLQKYFGEMVELSAVKMEDIEQFLEIKRERLL